MTEVFEARGVDSDRVDVGQRRWLGVVAVAVVGLVVGGAIGGLYGQSRPATYRATTAVSIQPDTNLASDLQNNNNNTTTLDAPTYVQSQLVILNGDPLVEQVQKQLSLSSKPDVSSTEIGQTYVVSISATASTPARSKAIATAMGAAYAKQRSSQFTARINQAIASTNAQLTTVQKSLTAAQAGTAAGTGVTPSETALQTEFERLLTVKSALALAVPQAGQLVTVFTPVGTSDGEVSTVSKSAIGGAALGALIALALLVLFRRSARRVRVVGDIADLKVPVLLPVLERKGLRVRRTPAAWNSNEGRLLAARLAEPGANRTDPIIIVGATPGVGATFVAASLATSLARRGPVLLITGATGSGTDAVTLPVDLGSLDRQIATTPVSGVGRLSIDYAAPRPFSGPSLATMISDIVEYAAARRWVVIVDTPALSESDLALDVSTFDGVAALVVGRNRSRPADVLSAFELFEARGKSLEGAILNDVPRRWFGASAPSFQLDASSPTPSREQLNEPDAANASGVKGFEGYTLPARSTDNGVAAPAPEPVTQLLPRSRP